MTSWEAMMAASWLFLQSRQPPLSRPGCDLRRAPRVLHPRALPHVARPRARTRDAGDNNFIRDSPGFAGINGTSGIPENVAHARRVVREREGPRTPTSRKPAGSCAREKGHTRPQGLARDREGFARWRRVAHACPSRLPRPMHSCPAWPDAGSGGGRGAGHHGAESRKPAGSCARHIGSRASPQGLARVT